MVQLVSQKCHPQKYGFSETPDILFSIKRSFLWVLTYVIKIGNFPCLENRALKHVDFSVKFFPLCGSQMTSHLPCTGHIRDQYKNGPRYIHTYHKAKVITYMQVCTLYMHRIRSKLISDYGKDILQVTTGVKRCTFLYLNSWNCVSMSMHEMAPNSTFNRIKGWSYF